LDFNVKVKAVSYESILKFVEKLPYRYIHTIFFIIIGLFRVQTGN